MRPKAKLHVTIVLASAIAAIVGAGGCSPPPPSEDAVLYYLRNARVHGGVRRAWPAGQAYVDKVLKADAVLRKKLNLLRPLGDPLALWPDTDQRWQDKDAVARRLEELAALAEEHRAEREAAFRALSEAVEKLPEGLPFAAPQEQAAFLDKVWTALAVDGVPLPEHMRRLEALLPPHIVLFQKVSAAVERVDPNRLGLAFEDAARQADILGKYAAVKAAAENGQEAWLRYAEEHWNTLAARLKSVDKHAQRWEYEWVGADQKNLKARLEAVPKSYQAAADGVTKVIDDLTMLAGKVQRPEEKSKLQTRIAAEQKRREALLATASAMKVRVDRIIMGPQLGPEAAPQAGQP